MAARSAAAASSPRDPASGRRAADPLRGRPRRRWCPDLAARLPGRGMWVSADRDVLEQGRRQQPVRQGGASAGRRRRPIWSSRSRPAGAALPRPCRSGAARRCSSWSGSTRWPTGCARGDARLVLVAARDGAADGRRQLGRWRGELPVSWLFDRTELGAALSAATRSCMSACAGRAGPAAAAGLWRGCRAFGGVSRMPAGQ